MKRLVAAGPAAHRPDREVLARRGVGPAPPRRVHDGRVVPRERAARGARRRLRGAAARGGARRRAAIAAALGLAAPFARTTVRELCARHAGIDLPGDEDAAALRAKATRRRRRAGQRRRPGTTSSIRCSSTASSRALAAGGPTFVFDWPAPLARARASEAGRSRASSSASSSTPAGLELANAFGELTDPVEQRRRFEDEARIRAARGQAGLPDRRGAAGRAAPDAAHRGDRPGIRPAGHARARRSGTSPRWSRSVTNADG